jgi:hypothetical protein
VTVEGQDLVFENKTNAVHSVKIEADEDAGNSNVNDLVAPGKWVQVGPFKVQRHEIPVVSTINPNMLAHIRVFSHPYFCINEANGEFVIKNAPAGTYRLVVWQPGHGWVVGDKTPDKFGMRITIRAMARITNSAGSSILGLNSWSFHGD